MVVTRSKRKREELAFSAEKHSRGSGFKYKPLEDPKTQIRLLKILPGDPDDPIRLQSDVFSLYHGPSYKAISYTWGSEEDSKIVHVDNEPLEVRNNCHYALWQVRLHFPGDWAWIDSICINQGDNDEKSYQVQMMFDIYDSAGLVLSCVGPHVDDSPLVVEATREVFGLLLVKYEHSAWKDLDFDHLEWASSRGEDFFIALRNSFENFSERPYWSRLWILQEMRASGVDCDRGLQILCGHDSLELWALRALSLFCSLNLEEVAKTFLWDSVDTSRFTTTALSSTFEVLDLVSIEASFCLSLVGSFYCSDPRDRLYGILPLIKWPDGFEEIQPDYSKSLWDIFLHLSPLLSPSGIFDALQVLDFGLSAMHLGDMARQRTSIEALRPLSACSLSHLAQRLETKAYPSRPTRLTSRYPLATVVTESNLRPLPRSVTAEIKFQMRRSIGTLFGVDCKCLDVAPYLPFGVFAGENPVILVDRRARTGDLVLNCGEFSLVMRHRKGSIYDVVGSAEWFTKGTSVVELTSRVKTLGEYCETDCGILYAKGSLALSLEDQMAFARLSRSFLKSANDEERLMYLQFVTQLIKKPEGAATLDLIPYRVKTDIDKDGEEWLCFEGHKECDNYPSCRNKDAG